MKSSRRRTKLEIYVSILRSLLKSKARAVHVMYRANLSFIQARSCLDFLVKKGLIEKEEEEKIVVYKITKKGKEFLENYKKIEKAIAES